MVTKIRLRRKGANKCRPHFNSTHSSALSGENPGSLDHSTTYRDASCLLRILSKTSLDMFALSLQVYHEAFAYLTEINQTHELIAPYFYLVQRLLEHLIASVQEELQLSQSGPGEFSQCSPIISVSSLFLLVLYTFW